MCIKLSSLCWRFVVGCMEFGWIMGWIGSWVQSFHFAIGLVWPVVWWVGSGWRNWTHGQLWSVCLSHAKISENKRYRYMVKNMDLLIQNMLADTLLRGTINVTSMDWYYCIFKLRWWIQCNSYHLTLLTLNCHTVLVAKYFSSAKSLRIPITDLHLEHAWISHTCKQCSQPRTFPWRLYSENSDFVIIH